jgi:hypothetical protein
MKRFGRPGLIYPNDLIIKILHLSDKVAVILTFAQFIDLLHKTMYKMLPIPYVI